MKYIQFKTPEDEALYNAILAIEPTWHEFPIEDHITYPQFNRKLVVKGFLDAPKDKYNNEVLNVFVAQILTIKETGVVHKEIPMKTWEIYEHNVEEIFTQHGLMMVDEIETEMQYDDEGNEIGEIEISRKEIAMKAPSIKLIKFMLKTKSSHLVEIFQKFMGMYTLFFADEINDI